MKLVLVTGLSGAGKSVALRTLEDAGFEAIDNVPLSFLPAVAGTKETSGSLAIGVDIRSRDFSLKRVLDALRALRARPDASLSILYLDCDDEVLRRRFTETRRRHPLAHDRPVEAGIRHERELLEGLRDIADAVIDTSDMSAADLRRIVSEQFARDERQLSIAVTSFSYKRGVPREADLVFDVRFLRNPHYVPELQPLTGREAPVGEYISQDPAWPGFFTRLEEFILPLLPCYQKEGKQYLTIAIGCTGGKHRSVYTAEKLAEFLQAKEIKVLLRHRELNADL